jgi:hypothetical protein
MKIVANTRLGSRPLGTELRHIQDIHSNISTENNTGRFIGISCKHKQERLIG